MTKKVNISTDSGADVQFVSAAVASKLKQHRKQQKLSLDELSRRAGEFVAAGAKAPVVLGDITRLQIRCDVDEQLATRMREGLPAKGYLKGESSLAGGKDRSIALKFVRIEPFVIPKTSLTGASIERVDTRVLQVIYQFDRPADRVLFVGQQMDVYIDASQNAPGK